MSDQQTIMTFNSPVETGLRCLVILCAAYDVGYSLQKMVVFDYLVVHSDDVSDGPKGLHPKTPYRSGELLVRRNILREGLMLYQSRGLVELRFQSDGVYYAATSCSKGFLDALNVVYVSELRDRARWVVEMFGAHKDDELLEFVNKHIGIWGGEFEWSSVLWAEEEV